MDAAIHWQILAGAGALGLVAGFLAARTDFCTLGGVSDWLNIGDRGRMRAWLLAIATAMLGVGLLEYSARLDLSQTFPPYRSAPFIGLRYLLGGLMFGVGMTLASGCVNKNLIRLGAGNLKALVVLSVIGASAYVMMWTDLYGNYLLPWMRFSTIEIPGGQALDSVIVALTGVGGGPGLRLGLAFCIAAALLLFCFGSAEFRANPHHWGSGLGIGSLVVAGWWLTGPGLGVAWQDWAAMSDIPPLRVATQSLTFVSALGDGMRFLSEPTTVGLISFSTVSALGVVAGSFLNALMTGGLRLEWFRDGATVRTQLIGAVLMGVGGSLAMGCTVGQGVTGVSTLALGSFVTLASIIIGSVVTMRIQYRLL